MKRRYLLLIGLIAVLLIVGIVGKSTGFLSTTYVTSDSGTTYKCGYYYSSAVVSLSKYQEASDLCEAEGFSCNVYEDGNVNVFSCQQLCYDCSEPEEFFLAVIAPDCDGDDHYSAWGTAVSVSDSINYYDGSISNAQLYDKYCGTSNMIDCFQCDGSDVDIRSFEDTCGNGWTTNVDSLDCSSDPITCYSCDGTDVISRVYEDNCASGWTTTQPDCEIDTIDCFSCNQQTNVLETQTVTGSVCPTGTSATTLNCNVDKVDCYQCSDDNVIQTNIFTGVTCEAGWTEYINYADIPKCGGINHWLKEYIDFENKPVQSGFLIVAILVLLYVLFTTVKDLTNKDNNNEVF